MRVEPSERGELAQPEVPLLLAGAEEEVAAYDLLIDRSDCGTAIADPMRQIEVLAQLEVLELERVVQVDHDRLVVETA